MRRQPPFAGESVFYRSGARLGPAICFFALVGIGLSTISRGQTYDVLHSFTVPPAAPAASLFKGSDGKLYGTTQRAGALSNGSVFQVDTAP